MHGLKPAPQSPYNNAHWPGPDARRLPSITLRGRLPHTRTSNHPLPPCVRAGRSLPQVFPSFRKPRTTVRELANTLHVVRSLTEPRSLRA